MLNTDLQQPKKDLLDLQKGSTTPKRPCSCTEMVLIFNIINNKWVWLKENTESEEL